MNPTIRRFDRNQQGRDFIVGDLHGMVDDLDALLDKVSFQPEDRLFILGDLVDRRARCHDGLLLLHQANIFSILGNHDYMMLRSLLDPNDYKQKINWALAGGSWYLDDMDSYHLFADEWIEILRNLPYTIKLETNLGAIGMVHANCFNDWNEFVKQLATSTTARETALWDRSRYQAIQQKARSQKVQGIDTVFFGHTIVDTPVHIDNLWYLDTGAFRLDSSLTMMQVQPEFINVTIDHQHTLSETDQAPICLQRLS